MAVIYQNAADLSLQFRPGSNNQGSICSFVALAGRATGLGSPQESGVKAAPGPGLPCPGGRSGFGVLWWRVPRQRRLGVRVPALSGVANPQNVVLALKHAGPTFPPECMTTTTRGL
jgi:hypothetical protein